MYSQQNIKFVQNNFASKRYRNFLQNPISKTTLSSPLCGLNILLTLTYLLTNLLIYSM